jgi:uncharacterized membrane protein YoaK (UPF0700 family)
MGRSPYGDARERSGIRRPGRPRGEDGTVLHLIGYRFALTVVAGSVNAIGFSVLAGVFLTGATGNVVHAGDALGGGDLVTFATFGTPVVAFVVLCALGLRLGNRLRHSGRDPVPFLGALELAALGAFGVATAVVDPDLAAARGRWEFYALCVVAVGAMACQYALVHTVGDQSVTGDRSITTVFVGVHLAAAARLLAGTDTGPTRRSQAGEHLGMVTAFFGGGAVTVALGNLVGSWALCLPMAVLAVLLATRSHLGASPTVPPSATADG